MLKSFKYTFFKHRINNVDKLHEINIKHSSPLINIHNIKIYRRHPVNIN